MGQRLLEEKMSLQRERDDARSQLRCWADLASSLGADDPQMLADALRGAEERSKALQADVAERSTRIIHLEASNIDLTAQAEELRRELEDCERTMAVLRGRCDEAEALDGLAQRLKRREEELEKSKKEAFEASSRLAVLEADCKQYQEELAAAQERAEEAREQASRLRREARAASRTPRKGACPAPASSSCTDSGSGAGSTSVGVGAVHCGGDLAEASRRIEELQMQVSILKSMGGGAGAGGAGGGGGDGGEVDPPIGAITRGGDSSRGGPTCKVEEEAEWIPGGDFRGLLRAISWLGFQAGGDGGVIDYLSSSPTGNSKAAAAPMTPDPHSAVEVMSLITFDDDEGKGWHGGGGVVEGGTADKQGQGASGGAGKEVETSDLLMMLDIAESAAVNESQGAFIAVSAASQGLLMPVPSPPPPPEALNGSNLFDDLMDGLLDQVPSASTSLLHGTGSGQSQEERALLIAAANDPEPLLIAAAKDLEPLSMETTNNPARISGKDDQAGTGIRGEQEGRHEKVEPLVVAQMSVEPASYVAQMSVEPLSDEAPSSVEPERTSSLPTPIISRR